MSKGKKQEIMAFVEKYSNENGIFPTLNEIKVDVKLKSVSTIHKHINDLVDKGILTLDEMGAYAISDKKPSSRTIPILGYIAAGLPIEVVEEQSSFIDVLGLPPKGTFYALKVKGDSMVDDGIFDSDIVVIKKQISAQNGQTVVAIIDDNQATLKKLFKEKGKFRLQPANQSMLPLYRDEVELFCIFR